MNEITNTITKKENAIYPYWVFKNDIDKDICNKIISYGKNKWIKAQVGSPTDNPHLNKDIRITDVAFCNDEWLFDLVWHYLNTANINSNWNFQVESCEPMQISKYEENGHYDFHLDGNGFTRYNMPENKFLHNKTRKLSMTIVLNEDYEGGEFEFFDEKRLIKEKLGTVIVFPSYMIHRVKPVTKGTRYSLVVWFCGEITSFSNEGGYFDCEKVRFYAGFPEKIGGWVKQSSNTYLGTARALHNWVALDNSNYMGVGTHLKYYIEEGGSFNDITPARKTSTNSITFSASDGSSEITVTDSSHGAVANDFVTIAGAASLGGLVTAAVLNQEYQIDSIVNANSYKITAKDTSGSTVTANASDSGNGGSGVDGVYQINVGLDITVGGNGWGAGGYGGINADLSTFGWGEAAATGTTAKIRLWSHDNFGEDLLINPRDAGVFYWDKSNGTGTRAVNITSLSGSSNAPTIAKQIMVSDIDRHVIVFGANTLGTTTQDSLLIRFGSQESLTDFTPTATNTAGDLRLSSGSTFVQAVETKQQILVFTDKSLFSMKFIGPPFTFGLQELSKSITIMSPKSGVAVDDAVFWMGKDNFYVYAGQTQQIPCTVRDKVFLDFNFAQSSKVVAGVNSKWGEIWGFYPSASSDENNKYVIYNYLEKVWYYGTLSRTAWHDRGIRQFPIAAESSHLFEHENGNDDDGSAMTASVESSQIDIGDGYQFTFIKQLIPDLTFNGSTSQGNPNATFTLQARSGPGSSYDTNSSGTSTRSSISPVEQFTDKINVRLRGRSFNMKLESTDQGVAWKLGTPRVDIRQDGRR
mgnify:CR=1 FL=1